MLYKIFKLGNTFKVVFHKCSGGNFDDFESPISVMSKATPTSISRLVLKNLENFKSKLRLGSVLPLS
jgi:hypothetical protein